eukprot:TRINITY_DN3729_c0_g1_i5.p1 TRINITY_DN3729_c0_g1~~TRINITY_DN3729_c0_g1_i5.p1  ORF type:complete len:790 (-),score=110.76 TRINITY_DN3729_c0_g1_i5:116-2236(-)
MASNMRCVEYIECDQCVTRTDAVIDEDRRTRAVGQMVDTIPELVLEEFTYSPLITNLTGSGSGLETDRYNLDAIDEPCFGCNDGQYIPQYSGKGVKIYVLDTGIRNDHNDFLNPDLRRTRATFGGYDAIDEFENSNQRGVDCNGHGTHCSGIAVGRISGVAKEAEVRSIRVLNCNSFGGFAGIIRALDHVLQQHRRDIRRPVNEYKGTVVSMSLAGPVVQSANDAVCRLVAAGVVVVTASGNFRRDACNYSPGSAGCHINVGGHYYTERDTDTCVKDVYWFTSRTTSPGSNYGRCVHILAPGQYVVSASYLDINRHISMSGTSMACPHVAGAAALILQANPRLRPIRVRQILEGDSCPDIDERRMHPSLRGQTPNRRLRVLKEIPIIPTQPATTTTPPAPATTTPVPLSCDTSCPFDTTKNSRIVSSHVVRHKIRNLQDIHLEVRAVIRSSAYFYNQILSKVSVTSRGDEITYVFILRKVTISAVYEYIFGEDNLGVAYEDIDSAIQKLNKQEGRTYYPQTIVPILNNRVFIIATYQDDCNDNEFRRANYDTFPSEVHNPFTIDNLLGTKASFDVSKSPIIDQIYVHNTVKPVGCDCYNYYNIRREELTDVSEQLGGDIGLVVTAIDSYYYDNKVYFTVTLCRQACYTNSPCVDEVVNSMVFADLDREQMQRLNLGAALLGMEPVAAVPYYIGEGERFAISYIIVS